MPIFDRPDGTHLAKVPALRKMMPHLMVGRNEAAVFFEQQIDLTKTLAYLAKRNAGKPEKELTLFEILLTAMARVFGERPQLNRFVVGRRVYQRKEIQFSFAIKRSMTDGGELTTTKATFRPDDTLATVAERIHGTVKAGKRGDKVQADVEVDYLTRLPRSILRFLIWLARALDYVNLLPGALVLPDPLYASMFFANLGSVGLESAYHHLYEYGTCPFFATVGRVKKAVVPGPDDVPVVREVMSIKYTFDERITDGFYCARSLERFKAYVEDPEVLETPPRA